MASFLSRKKLMPAGKSSSGVKLRSASGTTTAPWNFSVVVRPAVCALKHDLCASSSPCSKLEISGFAAVPSGTPIGMFKSTARCCCIPSCASCAASMRPAGPTSSTSGMKLRGAFGGEAAPCIDASSAAFWAPSPMPNPRPSFNKSIGLAPPPAKDAMAGSRACVIVAARASACEESADAVAGRAAAVPGRSKAVPGRSKLYAAPTGDGANGDGAPTDMARKALLSKPTMPFEDPAVPRRPLRSVPAVDCRDGARCCATSSPGTRSFRALSDPRRAKSTSSSGGSGSLSLPAKPAMEYATVLRRVSNSSSVSCLLRISCRTWCDGRATKAPGRALEPLESSLESTRAPPWMMLSFSTSANGFSQNVSPVRRSYQYGTPSSVRNSSWLLLCANAHDR
mmetsp:Transcript_10712/g.35592  ORF Transcript_10712/g.35592 Transcript_10712/m.35592 type:complete len:396 (+) Transcript_10712:876-2063(+)